MNDATVESTDFGLDTWTTAPTALPNSTAATKPRVDSRWDQIIPFDIQSRVNNHNCTNFVDPHHNPQFYPYRISMSGGPTQVLSKCVLWWQSLFRFLCFWQLHFTSNKVSKCFEFFGFFTRLTWCDMEIWFTSNRFGHFDGESGRHIYLILASLKGFYIPSNNFGLVQQCSRLVIKYFRFSKYTAER